MANPVAALTRKGSKSESWEEEENWRYNKTLDSWGVSQNLHFDKCVDLVVWGQEDMHGTGWLWWLLPLGLLLIVYIIFFTYFEKEKFAKNLEVMTKPERMSINMFIPTCVPNFMILTQLNQNWSDH